jgi:adenylate cyclase
VATDLVIILSSDWVGSTQARADLGEDAADAVQELHDTLLRRVIAAEGGTVVKHYGDGVMATFNSASAALAAAVKIRSDFAAYRESPDAMTRIDVRVGLAAGDVKHQTGDIFGLPVVEAVRLQAVAAPNEILCSDLVRILSQGRGGFEFEDAGVLELKGLPAPVHALKVRRPEADGRNLQARAATAQPGVTRPTASRMRLRYALAALSVVAIIAAGLWSQRGSIVSPARDSLRATSATAAEPALERNANSIAVLPFTNLSANTDDSYFALALHEEVLNQLAKLPDFTVISRTSVMPYAEQRPSIREIAEALQVESVLEGSVRYAGSQFLVTAQLIDPQTDAHIWSNTYRGDRDNVDELFAVQERIAKAIVTALNLQPTATMEPIRQTTTSPVAYARYLKAVSLLGNFEFSAAIRELNTAIEIDDAFAAAYAQRAYVYAYGQVVSNSWGQLRPVDGGPSDFRALSLENAERALALDPSSGLAWTVRALSSEFLLRFPAADEAFERSLALSPNDPSVLREYALFLAFANRQDEATAVVERAVRLDPNGSLTRGTQTIVLASLGRDREVLAAAEQGLLLEPTSVDLHVMVARAAARLSDPARAEAHLRTAESLIENTPNKMFLGSVGALYATLGLNDDSQRTTQRYGEWVLAPNGPDVGDGIRAGYFLSIGEPEQAYRSLARAVATLESGTVDAGFFSLVQVFANRADPRLQDPRFQDLIGRLQRLKATN